MLKEDNKGKVPFDKNNNLIHIPMYMFAKDVVWKEKCEWNDELIYVEYLDQNNLPLMMFESIWNGAKYPMTFKHFEELFRTGKIENNTVVGRFNVIQHGNVYNIIRMGDSKNIVQ